MEVEEDVGDFGSGGNIFKIIVWNSQTNKTQKFLKTKQKDNIYIEGMFLSDTWQVVELLRGGHVRRFLS